MTQDPRLLLLMHCSENIKFTKNDDNMTPNGPGIAAREAVGQVNLRAQTGEF